MAKIIYPFPILREKQKCQIVCEMTSEEVFHFSFLSNGIRKKLEMKMDENGYFLEDKEKKWHPDNNAVCLHCNFSLQNCDILFGKDGIISRNAELGIGLEWMSASSKQRGVVVIGSVKCDDKKQTFSCEYTFDIAQLRGEVCFRVVLYVKKAGKLNKDELPLANVSGYRLGELHYASIILDGCGSELPVYEVDEPDNRLLWYMHKYWSEPAKEKFSDSFSIYFNTANKYYKQLSKIEEGGLNPLMTEVLSSVFSTLIQEVVSDSTWNMDSADETLFEKGSLAAAIQYYLKTFEIGGQSPLMISESIRKHLS